jgi:hypothetical protein
MEGVKRLVTDVELALSAISAFLVAIQVILVYRVERTRLKIERFVGIGEKSELEIKPRIQYNSTEIIDITNNGTVPIEELSAKIGATIKRRSKPDLSFSASWTRKTVLSPKETDVIPLNEKISDFFKKNKLVTISNFDIGTVEDPETGDEVEDSISVASLTQALSLMLDLEIDAKIQGQATTTRKKYWLIYRPRLYPHPDYEDDYEVTINEHMGEWNP